jgi:hypothetical protein
MNKRISCGFTEIVFFQLSDHVAVESSSLKEVHQLFIEWSFGYLGGDANLGQINKEDGLPCC